MKLIDALTADPKQRMFLIGENGERIGFAVYYVPTQQGWFFNISYSGITANGLRLVAGLNALRAFRNRFPFGLSCFSADGLDPYYINDFSTGRIKLYLLNSEDVENAEAAYQ